MLRALALLLLLAGPAAAQPAHDALRIGISQFPSNLNPNIDSMAAKSYVLGLTQRPLTTYDPSWQLVCMLCTELPTIENGKAVVEPQPDGTKGVALTYTIREGARWGDGVPVSTKDVLFTWEAGRHPQSGVGNAEMYRRIERIDVLDEHTFTLHDRKLSFNYNAINDFRLLPAHLEEAVFRADPATWRNRTTFDTDPTNPGLAFGPYRIAEIVPGSAIRLVRNPTWWGEPPAFAEITVKAVENTAALEANLLAGEVDMIEGGLGLSLDQAIAFERRNAGRYQVVYRPGLTFEHLDLAETNPALADRRVRQALLLGSNRELLSQKLFAGRQPVAATFVHPLDKVFAADLPPIAFDPARAATLLDQAGWRAGLGGIRRNAAGEPLRVELIAGAGNRTRELTQQVLQSQWRGLGIEVSLRTEPPRVLFGDTLDRRRFTGAALFAWISSPENPPRSTFHSEEIPSEANGWSGQNYGGYQNPAMDALIDGIEVELDAGRRQAMWHDLQALYQEDLPSLPLFHRVEAHIWPLWLDGVTPTGHLAPTTLWVERWRVREG